MRLPTKPFTIRTGLLRLQLASYAARLVCLIEMETEVMVIRLPCRTRPSMEVA